ncbi:MAG: hypothetical protein BEN19_01435 [Epulopiscium sp. Nuni2H_MBin003]|nr:MAG: hypothetical protein BEN19_01435 [Epulopiscium sp. Nuni2H_MBin003]
MQMQQEYKTIANLSIGIIMSILLFFSGYYLYNYFNPTIYGAWRSTSTDQIVEFRRNGEVIIGNTDYIAYIEVISPTKMRYIVDNKTFEMYYQIEGRKLYWGLDIDDLEEFNRD